MTLQVTTKTISAILMIGIRGNLASPPLVFEGKQCIAGLSSGPFCQEIGQAYGPFVALDGSCVSRVSFQV